MNFSVCKVMMVFFKIWPENIKKELITLQQSMYPVVIHSSPVEVCYEVPRLFPMCPTYITVGSVVAQTQ